MTELYCLDTTALINPWNRFYPSDLTPGYWAGLERLVTEGRVVMSEEVRDEIRAQRDELTSWVNAHVSSWYPLTDDVQGRLTEIMGKWGAIAKKGKRNRADPVVIATAWALGAIVVTEEGPGSESKPSIPYICGHVDVRAISVPSFVREARINLSGR